MKKITANMKKGLVLFFVLIVVLSMGMVASADDYYIANALLGPKRSPQTFEVTETIAEIAGLEGQLSGAQDLFIDQNNYLYIADTNNNRVVVLDEQHQLVRVIGQTIEEKEEEPVEQPEEEPVEQPEEEPVEQPEEEPGEQPGEQTGEEPGEEVEQPKKETVIKSVPYGKDNLPMNKPQGLYVDEIGDIFVADTENGRILHLTAEGAFVEEFFEPDEPTYDTSYQFRPSKVALDSFGRIYVTNSNDYHGIILIDGENTFLGYIASTKVVTTLMDKLVRVFASEEQLKQLSRATPAYFSNFTVKDNFIYGTSLWAKTGEVRKLTPAGGNVLVDKKYGEVNESEKYNTLPAFVDVAVDSHGVMYAAENVTGKIYLYDQETNNLIIFGGIGRNKGLFQSLASVAINSKDTLYALDSELNTVQVFRPTELMTYILTATDLFYEGRYDEAAAPWNEVLKLDKTNYLANIGLAKAAYRQGDNVEAMKLYEHYLDVTGYSDAFNNYRLGYYRDYFIWLVLILLVALVGLYLAVSRLKRYADGVAQRDVCTSPRLGFKGYAKFAMLMIFHPIDCCYFMKRHRKKLSIWPPLILFIGIVAVRLLSIYATHFPLADAQMVYADLWQQLGVFLLPLVSWIVIGYALISISDGKQTFLEMLTSTLYAFLPYILFLLPLCGLSHLLSAHEAGVYNFLVILIWVWSLCLVFVTTKVMNEYSFGKMVVAVLKVFFAMLCAWMIVALFYVIVYQAGSFVSSVYEEFMLMVK